MRESVIFTARPKKNVKYEFERKRLSYVMLETVSVDSVNDILKKGIALFMTLGVRCRVRKTDVSYRQIG